MSRHKVPSTTVISEKFSLHKIRCGHVIALFSQPRRVEAFPNFGHLASTRPLQPPGGANELINQHGLNYILRLKVGPYCISKLNKISLRFSCSSNDKCL